MDITIDRKRGKKKSVATSEMQSKDNTNQKIKDDEYMIEGRLVKTPPESKEVLELSDEDPGLLKWMDEKQEQWRKKHPNLTQEELDRRIDEIIESEKELRKKSQY